MATRVLVGMPMRPGSKASHAAVKSAGKCTADKDLQIVEGETASSLLNYNFNILLAQAYNVHADYFALIHDDVVPRPYWLDTMLQIIQEKDLDALSAVIPIRSYDGKGLTSTAYTYVAKDGSADMTDIHHLSMNDVMELPKTFSMETVERRLRIPQKEGLRPVLLCNTGLLVIRLNNVMRGIGSYDEKRGGILEPLHFRNTDRIIRNGAHCSAAVLPEDWIMSILLTKGLSPYVLRNGIAATRAVELYHDHPVYNNYTAWGTAKHETASADAAG